MNGYKPVALCQCMYLRIPCCRAYPTMEEYNMKAPYVRDPIRLSIPRNWYSNNAARIVSPMFWKGITCNMPRKTVLRLLEIFHEIFANNAMDIKRIHTAFDTGAPPARLNHHLDNTTLRTLDKHTTTRTESRRSKCHTERNYRCYSIIDPCSPSTKRWTLRQQVQSCVVKTINDPSTLNETISFKLFLIDCAKQKTWIHIAHVSSFVV